MCGRFDVEFCVKGQGMMVFVVLMVIVFFVVVSELLFGEGVSRRCG